MTDATSLGSWSKPAPYLSLENATSFKIWEKLSIYKGFGNVKPFIMNVFESTWQSFTVTFHNDELFNKFTAF